jgi:hypothetical protein
MSGRVGVSSREIFQWDSTTGEMMNCKISSRMTDERATEAEGISSQETLPYQGIRCDTSPAPDVTDRSPDDGTRLSSIVDFLNAEDILLSFRFSKI